MGLEEWVEAGRLKRHETDRDELAELLAVADRAVADARVEGLTPDGKFGLAWPAVLALGAAALAGAGYRVGKERHHERVVDSLLHTVGLSGTEVSALHRVRRMRNEMTYERVGTATREQADAFLARVVELRITVHTALTKRYPELR